MRILVCGVFNVENSTNIFLAKAFRKAGHIVDEFDYRDVSSKVGQNAMNAGLAYEVLKTRPDLVFICKGDGLEPSAIKNINLNSKTFYWFPDPIITAAPHLIKLASVCTYASCTGLGVAKFFVANGVSKAFHIFEGVDPEYYYPVEEVEDFKADISFVGSRTPERMDYLYNLGAEYLPRVYGSGFGLEVKGESFRKICSSSKIILSINSQNDIESYFSDRIFLALACESFVFQKYTPGLENYFDNEKHLVWFHDINELLALTKKYLSDEKKEERKRISEEGYKHVLLNYTWDVTVAKILESIKE